jgi:hypothetical protein
MARYGGLSLIWTAACVRLQGFPFSLVLDRVAQHTHPLDLHFEDIARVHENTWLARHPNATGCSGDDHIARLQTFYLCATDPHLVQSARAGCLESRFRAL